MFLLLVWIPLSNVKAQDTTRESSAVDGDRRFTLVAGVGNAMGWNGVQGEKYFRRDRFSFFAGLGYTTKGDAAPGGLTVAVGVRGFTAGAKHRAFLELSVSQVIVVHFAAHPPDGQRLYAPGLQAGYQYTARRGFRFLASAGVGYAIGKEPVAGLHEVRSVGGLAGLGVGYTWRWGGHEGWGLQAPGRAGRGVGSESEGPVIRAETGKARLWPRVLPGSPRSGRNAERETPAGRMLRPGADAPTSPPGCGR
jgi:hypothetical protein